MQPGPNFSFATTLEEPDIRGLVRLIGGISGMDEEMVRKKELLLSGLCTLIEADGWAWSLTERRGARVICLDALSGGDQATMTDRKPQLNRRTTGLPTKAGGAGRTLSICELAGNRASQLIFGRRASRPPFSEREEEMARIVVEEVAWLHELNPVCTPLHTEVHLSARQRETFILLAHGLSHKAIAERLGISTHTVHDYIKALHRIFGIHSHAELIKQFELQGPHLHRLK